MSNSKKESRPSVSVNFGGGNYGLFNVGDGNTIVVNEKTGEKTEISARELKELFDAFAALRRQVATEVPAAQRDAALEQVEALHSAILPHPKVGKIEAARDWFIKHTPWIAGAVTSVVINPIVGKIVEAAGEMAAGAFRKRFS